MHSILHTETNKQNPKPPKKQCHNSVCVCMSVCDVCVSVCLKRRKKKSVNVMYNLYEYGVKCEEVSTR